MAVAPRETVVRRVMRVTRRAAMMQRVTGVFRATHALQPLDSTLTIRVLDQRGEALAEVAVRWTMIGVGDGAALQILDARTDSLGLSRARFSPGRSADTQRVAAEVPGIGRIEFTVNVAVASLRILPPRAIVWAGEEQVMGAELRDVGGVELPGGALSWASANPAAVRVRSEDASRSRVTGVLAGTTPLVAWLADGVLRDTAMVTVKPVLAGRFVTLDGSVPPAMRMEVRAGSFRDSIPARDGEFRERLEIATESEVDVRANAATDTSRYHAVWLRVASQAELQNLVVALVPTRWRIDAGSYQGQVVAIDAERALLRGARGSAFWRIAPISGSGPRKLLGWRQADLPLRVAFNRGRSSEPVTADDSVKFWSIVAQMERDLGETFFAPADMRDSGRADFVPVEITAQLSEAHTFVSWSQPGDASDGVLLFRRAATLRDPHVVTHELLHVLGFGHTSAWKTVSLQMGGVEQRLTPEDVAYVQLATRLRRLQERTGARPGLPVAVQ